MLHECVCLNWKVNWSKELSSSELFEAFQRMCWYFWKKMLVYLDDLNWSRCWSWTWSISAISATWWWWFHMNQLDNLIWGFGSSTGRPTTGWWWLLSTIDIDDLNHLRWCIWTWSTWPAIRATWVTWTTWAGQTEECCWCCAYTKCNNYEHLCSLTEKWHRLVLVTKFSLNPISIRIEWVFHCKALNHLFFLFLFHRKK